MPTASEIIAEIRRDAKDLNEATDIVDKYAPPDEEEVRIRVSKGGGGKKRKKVVALQKPTPKPVEEPKVTISKNFKSSEPKQGTQTKSDRDKTQQIAEAQNRYIEERAVKLSERSERFQDKFTKRVDKLKVNFLLPKEDDTKTERFFDTLGLGLFNIANPDLLGGAVAQTVDKAVLRGQLETVNLLGNLDKEKQSYLIDLRQKSKEAAIKAVTPITKNPETGLVEFNPEGAANIVIAGVAGGLRAKSQITAKQTAANVVPKTKGGTAIKDITVKGTTTSKGQTTGQPQPLAQQTQTVISYKDPRAGILNQFKKPIETTVRTTKTGTIIRTQKTGPNSYVRTVLPKGKDTGTVYVVQNGKVVKQAPIKADVSKSNIVKYEDLVTVKEKPLVTQINKNVLIQDKAQSSIYNVGGKLDKRTTVKGGFVSESEAIATSVSGLKTTISGKTQPTGFKTTNVDVSKSTLKPPKGDVGLRQAKLTTQSVKTPTGYDTTFTQAPKVDTSFSYVNKFSGNLLLQKQPGAGSKAFDLFVDINKQIGKRGSLGPGKTQTTFAKTPKLGPAEGTAFDLNLVNVPKQNYGTPFTFSYDDGSKTTGPNINTESQIQSKTDNVQFQPPDTAPRTESIIGLDFKQEQIPDTAPDVKVTPKKKSEPIQEVKAPQIVEPTPRTITQPQPKPKQQPLRQQTPFSFPRTQLPPKTLLVSPPVKLPDAPQKKTYGFNVLVRVKGEFKRINKGALSKSEALNFGAYRVGTTAAASFKIESSDEEVKDRFLKKGMFANFYKKGKVYIEERGKRIKSRGELKEITFKGVAASKRKNRVNKVFGG